MAKYNGQLIRKFDDPISGNALANGRVEVLDESFNQAPIFEDEQMTVPKPNPFAADSNGFYEFFIADGTYNFILGTAPETLVVEGVSIGQTGGSGGGLSVGMTILANINPGADFLKRDGMIYPSADYPLISGTPGFPEVGIITGYNDIGNYVSPISKSTSSNTYLLDNDQRIFIPTINKVIYSTDGLTTEMEILLPTGFKYSIASDNSQYIVVGAGAGLVEILDYTDPTMTSSSSAGSANLIGMEYDDFLGLFVALNSDGDIYTAPDPTSTWTFARNLGIPGETVYQRMHRSTQGYLAGGQSTDNLWFYSDILSSPGLQVLTSGLLPQFTKAISENGDGLVGINRDFVYETNDGGQTLSLVPVNTKFINDLVDLLRITTDIYVASCSFGRIFVTFNRGVDWTEVSYTATGNSEVYANATGDFISMTGANRTRSDAILDPNTSFIATNIDSPTSTDDYYTRGR